MNDLYAKARIAKDRNFDGKFYFGVKSTGIFCRPSCPAPVAKEANVVYLDSMFEALERGFTPCYRCRPDLETEYYNGNAEGSQCVAHALEMIENGFLNLHSVGELAEANHLSERHLRRLFLDNLGTAPHRAGEYHRAIFAKRLIVGTKRNFSEIASASGFHSLRQFNDVMKKRFGRTPSEIRKLLHSPGADTVFRLPYRQPFCFSQLLEFMRPRAIPGVESVTDVNYTRTFQDEYGNGIFTVADEPEHSRLRLTVDCDDLRSCMNVCNRVRRMFDLAADVERIAEVLGQDPLLFEGAVRIPRLPVAFEPFEFIVRAILGQQITVKAATTLAGRIAGAAGLYYCDRYRIFPTPAQFLQIDLSNLGIVKARQETLRTIAGMVFRGELNLSGLQDFESFRSRLLPVKGIGEWTVNYVAMRGLGMRDCFPAADLGILKATAENGKRKTPKEILRIAERWRPYRSYAALCLWQKKPIAKSDLPV